MQNNFLGLKQTAVILLIFNTSVQMSQKLISQKIFPKFSPSDLQKYTSVSAINWITGKNRATKLVVIQAPKTDYQPQNK